MKRILIVVLLLMAAGAAAYFAFWRGKKAPPVAGSEVRALYRDQLPSSLEDEAWDDSPVYTANLILQDMVEPRLLKPSTQIVKIQTVSDGRKLAFRMQWDDVDQNDAVLPGNFADACAVQMPAKMEADLPAPQMGEEGRPVEIVYWSASWQASVNGRKDEIKSLYPRAAVDHYPFQSPSLQQGSTDQQEMAKRYAPAHALGNHRSGPRTQPVEDLIAEGPGTLEPAPQTTSTGNGKRTETGWEVLLVRNLPEAMKPGARGQIAFAIWQGSKQEVGSRKMRTAWIPFALEAKAQ